MSESLPFSIRIFVTNGDPDGLRIVERSNWPGKALVFPRSLLPAVKRRTEFQQTGVYLLLGPREDGDGDQLYIGEGDPVLPRLESHYAQKDFWNRAAFFVTSTGALNKAHVQYLESQLIRRAQEAKRIPLDNQIQPKLPTLNEADQADMDVFLEHMLQILPLIGISAFETVQRNRPEKRQRLSLEGKDLRAQGYESTEGFVVVKGSDAAKEPVPSMKVRMRGYFELRQSLIDKGVLVVDGDKLIFTQDYSFNSPSAAAAVILGRSANGRTEWKDMHGKTLKAIQEKQATNGGVLPG